MFPIDVVKRDILEPIVRCRQRRQSQIRLERKFAQLVNWTEGRTDSMSGVSNLTYFISRAMDPATARLRESLSPDAVLEFYDYGAVAIRVAECVMEVVRRSEWDKFSSISHTQ
ncbi:hypothetical protein Scep_025217 [Stephania cephalantha]|uniref:Uncharacterized protein n=1 Tax=Stephania cephalantha TaxID=152367 RepID=A0AAP0HM51_9MAGN